MRVAIGSFMHEGNTFVPFRTELSRFENAYMYRGEEILHHFGDAKVEVPGFLSVLESYGIEPVPLIATNGFSGGPLTRDCFETIARELISRLQDAGHVDGVLLALHGAMAIEDSGDAEGELLERVRAVLPTGTPIGVSLDLHGHITQRMLQPDVFMIGYREYPHIDMFETGARVATLMVDRLHGRARPVMALAKKPMIVSPVRARSGEPPLSEILAYARQLENNGLILHASLFTVQPWLDVPDLGFAALVCANDFEQAESAARELAQMAWDRRDDFEPELTSLQEAIAVAMTSEGVTVVGDSGDAPSSGSAADNPGVLQALLAAGADRADGRLTYLTICDPPAAEKAIARGVGSTVELSLGHWFSKTDGNPIQITATVRSVSDGLFVSQDAGAKGSRINQGPTAVLDIGDIRLVVRSIPVFEWDSGIFTAFGLDIQKATLVFAKSPSHFRTAYQSLAERILVADSPGPTTTNMRRLTFKHVGGPLYPVTTS